MNKSEPIEAEILNKPGRPKRNFYDEFPEEWREMIIRCYSQGMADVNIRALIAMWTGACSHDVWSRWLKEEPEFKEVIELGRQLAESWWFEKGRTGMDNTRFNSNLYALQMRNRFKWNRPYDAMEDEEEEDIDILTWTNEDTHREEIEE